MKKIKKMEAKLIVLFVSALLLASFCTPIDGGYVDISPSIHSMLPNLNKEESAIIDSNKENPSSQQKRQIYVREQNADQIVFPGSEPEPHPPKIETIEQARKPPTVSNRDFVSSSEGQIGNFCSHDCGHGPEEQLHQDHGLIPDDDQH